MSRLPGLDWRKSWSSQGPLTKGLSKWVLFSFVSFVRRSRCTSMLRPFIVRHCTRNNTSIIRKNLEKKCPGFSLLYLGEGRAIIYPLSGFRVAWLPTVGLWGLWGNHLFIGDYSFQQPNHVMKFLQISLIWLRIYFMQGSHIGPYFHCNNGGV